MTGIQYSSVRNGVARFVYSGRYKNHKGYVSDNVRSAAESFEFNISEVGKKFVFSKRR
jgi:hypothetical protein